ncbi:hypothetical protein pb186bvf_006244 [Paramecium bursaria]
MNQSIKVIVTKGSQKYEMESEPFVSITDILQQLNIDGSQKVKINGSLINNLNSQIQQFNQSNIVNIEVQSKGIQILSVMDQKTVQQQQIEQNGQKLFKFTINIQNGHSKSSFEIEFDEQSPMKQIEKVVYEKLGFYDQARNMADIDLYVNQQILKGVKLGKSPSDLNYPTGTVIEAKLRWIGGK